MGSGAARWGRGGGGERTIKSNDSGKYFCTAFRPTFRRARSTLDLSFSPSLSPFLSLGIKISQCSPTMDFIVSSLNN